MSLSQGMSEAPGVDSQGPSSGKLLCHVTSSAQCFGEINSWFKGKKCKHPFGGIGL